jgi:hypothetical protein
LPLEGGFSVHRHGVSGLWTVVNLAAALGVAHAQAPDARKDEEAIKSVIARQAAVRQALATVLVRRNPGLLIRSRSRVSVR